MQDNEHTGSNESQRVDIEESYINFRPSQNFRNMKKFLKTKIQKNEPEPSTPELDLHITPELDLPIRSMADPMPEQKPAIYPPLPTDPPPPVSPSLSVDISALKQEIMQENFEDEMATASVNLETLKQEFETKPGQKVCNEYIRGNCTRVPCKYLHVDNPTQEQLRGAYTFCHKFQNKVCNLPDCKFIHATVIEELRFYRTRLLPPNALSHIKNKNTVTPARPATEPAVKTTVTEGFFTNTPPMHNFVTNSCPPPAVTSEKQMPMVRCISAEALGAGSLNENSITGLSPLRPNCNVFDGRPSPPPPMDLKHNDFENCCPTMNNRLDHSIKKVKMMISKHEEHCRLMAELDAKNKRLRWFLVEYLRPNSILLETDVEDDVDQMLAGWDSKLQSFSKQ